MEIGDRGDEDRRSELDPAKYDAGEWRLEMEIGDLTGSGLRCVDAGDWRLEIGDWRSQRPL